jgi:hypothetical protein
MILPNDAHPFLSFYNDPPKMPSKKKIFGPISKIVDNIHGRLAATGGLDAFLRLFLKTGRNKS